MFVDLFFVTDHLGALVGTYVGSTLRTSASLDRRATKHHNCLVSGNHGNKNLTTFMATMPMGFQPDFVHNFRLEVDLTATQCGSSKRLAQLIRSIEQVMHLPSFPRANVGS
eukprot:SAG11_NODE_2124_length_3784_cov_1.668657_4_plen_111_part_00